MSPLSNVQFSRCAEFELGKILTLGGGGLLEVLLPMSDDNRRDIETYLKDHFGLTAALQLKARHVLIRHNRAELLVIRFDEKRERLIASPFFFYVFGYLDIITMQYRPPLFLVPSEIVHREADPRAHGDLIRFTFAASMDPASKDRWRPYACEPAEIAQRMVKFLRAQARRRTPSERLALTSAATQPGTILVARAA